MLDNAVVVCGVARFKNRSFIAVRKFNLAVDADDELLAFMGGHHWLGVRRKLYTERIHVAIGFADGERIVRVSGLGLTRMRNLDGIQLSGACDGTRVSRRILFTQHMLTKK